MTKRLIVLLLVLLSSGLIADDLTSILGKPWKADAVQDLFSSNYVGRYSVTVATDSRSGITTSNMLYVVAHPSQNTNEFLAEWHGLPPSSHIPNIEIKTELDSASNRTEVITSIEVFNTKYGKDVLPSFAKSLEVPSRLLNLAHFDSASSTRPLTLWLWNRPRIYDDNQGYVSNCPENGRIAYDIGFGTVYLWFDHEELFSIQYSRQHRAKPPSGTHTNIASVVDLQFLKFNTPWLLSVETNSLSLSNDRIRQMVERNLSCGERGKPIYEKMLDLGYTLERDLKYWGPPITNRTRWYTSPNGFIIIETFVKQLMGLHLEKLRCVYIDVVKAGGPKNITLPNQVLLPETSDECLLKFKCIYSQTSRNGKRLLLCCDEGTFLYEEGRLIEVRYTGKDNSTSGIYDLPFHRF